MGKFIGKTGEVKVGAKVLVTNATITFGEYENGDVLTVSAVGVCGEETIDVKEIPDGPYLKFSEFEVLLATKPLIGDLVRINGGSNGYSRVGDITEVTDFNMGGVVLEHTDGSYAGFKLMRNVEKVTEAPEESPTVGDTVVLAVPEGKRPVYGWGGVFNGEEGTVVRIDGDKIEVKIPNFSTRLTWTGERDELRVIKKAEEFSVGDRVSFDKQSYVLTPDQRTGRIIEINSGRFEVGIDNYGGGPLNFRKESLTKLNEEVINVGDLVRIVKEQSGHPKGAIVEVADVLSGDMVRTKAVGPGGAVTQYYADTPNIKLIAKSEDRVDG